MVEQNKVTLLKDTLVQQFPDGFRILKESSPDDKFLVIDEFDIQPGSLYRVGPNGYFEYVGNDYE